MTYSGNQSSSAGDLHTSIPRAQLWCHRGPHHGVSRRGEPRNSGECCSPFAQPGTHHPAPSPPIRWTHQEYWDGIEQVAAATFKHTIYLTIAHR